MTTKYLITLLLLSCISAHLEAQQWKNDLRAFLTNDQKDVRTGIPAEIRLAGSYNVLAMIHEYLQDSAFEVRLKALELTHHLAITSADSLNRQQGVHLLASSIADLELAGQALSLLTGYQRGDFSQLSRNIIRQHIDQKHTYLNELMRMAGYLRLTDARPVMVKYSAPGNPASTRWAALISLARMGDTGATSEIMTRVQRLPVNDDVVYNVFPDLIFTRQPGPVDYMAQAMQRDEKNCFSADAERETPIPCAYRIAEQLAPIIDGFPLVVDESGDLIATDYVAAMASLKEWFVANPQYKIVDNTY